MQYLGFLPLERVFQADIVQEEGLQGHVSSDLSEIEGWMVPQSIRDKSNSADCLQIQERYSGLLGLHFGPVTSVLFSVTKIPMYLHQGKNDLLLCSSVLQACCSLREEKRRHFR